MRKIFEIVNGNLIPTTDIRIGSECQSLPLKGVKQLAIINGNRLTVGMETGEPGNRHFLVYYIDKLRDYFYPHLFFRHKNDHLISEEGFGGELEKWGVVGEKIYSMERSEIPDGIVEIIGKTSSSTDGGGKYIFRSGKKYYSAELFINDKYICGKEIIAKFGPVFITENGFNYTILGCYLLSLLFLADGWNNFSTLF